MNIEDRINPWLKTPFDEEIHLCIAIPDVDPVAEGEDD